MGNISFPEAVSRDRRIGVNTDRRTSAIANWVLIALGRRVMRMLPALLDISLRTARESSHLAPGSTR
jgi:hypothetical protein